jgi:DNA mismatch repair protein MLH1
MAILIKRGDMLREYFAMDIDPEGNLLTLPQVLDNYVPNMDLLPRFALDLGGCNWSEEQTCFHTVAKALARFYAVSRPEGVDEPASALVPSSAACSAESMGT